MLKNNNQEIVKKISRRTLTKNKTRNIFVIIAIVLTTFMFTTVFTIGFSLVKNLNTMMLRQQGTKSTVFLPEPDQNQIKKVKELKSLYAAGLKIQTGTADIPGTGNKILLDWYDITEFNDNFKPAISDINGRYPSEADEIMLSKSALDALKIDKPEKDMQIQLKQNSFRLSGWFTDYAYHSGGYQGFISDAYIDKAGLTVEKDGMLCMSAKPGKQYELVSSFSQLKLLRKGQDIQSEFDIQEENKDTAAVTTTVILLIGFIIVISGYLLIYNVMYISITKDIRFYGMLKTTGTSPSQIRKIVKHQASSLSVIGIPAGIILGIIMSFAAVPFALKMTGSYGIGSAMPSDISFNPLIYIGTILFAIFTVFASCRKPSKLAEKVSPVEALKYNGTNSVKYKAKKGTDGGKLYKMACRNVFREKKRALLVFASLFMGTMAFLSANTFIGSMKLDNYVNFYLPNDYTIYTDSDQPDLLKEIESLAEKIKDIEGIKNIHVNHSANTVFEFDENIFKPFLENSASDEKELKTLIDYYRNTKDDDEKYQAPVVSVNSDMMKLYNTKAKQKIDIERFEKGEICLLGFVSTEVQSDYMLGKKITLRDIESGRTKTLEIGSCPTIEDDYGINVGYHWMKYAAPEIVLISDTALNEFCDNPGVDNIIIDCNPEAESFITPKIKEAAKTNASVLEIKIKSEVMSEFVSSMSAMNILSGGISIVLILIGIINFINVMLTGVYTRKAELSVMESVGMTKKQVKKMLVLEGVYYGLITTALILTAGNLIIYKVADLAQDIADYAVFHYPVVLMFIIIAVIMGICMAVPMVIYQTVSKDSITERLRE